MAVSMFVVIMAQSSATSRAYAVRYEESFDENADLLALGFANFAAACTGTFVVNGSPTKTEMLDAAGGRTQLATLTTSAVVVLVLLFLTGPLAVLPTPALAAVVFLIGIELVDVPGMRRIWLVRRDEFAVALVTAAAVVFLGVEEGILVAIAASIVDHLRHSYSPASAVLVDASRHSWRLMSPTDKETRTRPGLVVYRFGSSLYYANAHRLFEDSLAFATAREPLSWLCIDAVAIGDIDYSAGATLCRLAQRLQDRGVRLCFSEVSPCVKRQLEAYGVPSAMGEATFFATAHEAADAFDNAQIATHAGAPSPTQQLANAHKGSPMHGSHPDPAF
jgi:MFS superfamily sulfate permease-like transporter